MIAFHVPPLRGSSGIQRTLSFARYLPGFGWEPHILSAHPRAYEATDGTDSLASDLPIHRAFALDASRHLAFRNRYPAFLARPDRWICWWLGAVPAGLALIRRLRPDALWSTYPIATAHAIGDTLARLSGLPWIADFRDPMAQDGYPPDPAVWRSFKRIEARAIARAHHSVFTTPGAAAQYRLRYPERAKRVLVIENGYDEAMFDGLAPRARDCAGEPLVILHSGIVYPWERDPSPLFAALGALRRRGSIGPERMKLRFRAPVHDALLRDLASRHGIADMIEIMEPAPYRDALAEMVAADALLLLQAANCNEQIPAKLYEYLRAGRPVLGLADPRGDTGQAMHRARVDYIAALEDATAIGATIERFIADWRAGRAVIPDPAHARTASRRERTAELARTLDAAVADRQRGCAA